MWGGEARSQEYDEPKFHAVGCLRSADHCPDNAIAALGLLRGRVEGLPGAQEGFSLVAEHTHDVATKRDRTLVRGDGLLEPRAPPRGGHR